MQSDTSSFYDYLIVGAGPAGLQMGYYMEKRHRNYVILEAGDTSGTFFKQFPRHRTLISINKVYTGITDPDTNLRWDWNSLLSDSEEMVFRHYSKKYFPAADDYVRYLNDYACHFKLKITYGAKVVSITKPEHFLVRDSQGHSYSCKCLIIATGRSVEVTPQVPGIELSEPYSTVSTCSQDFTNQRVMIIGKGNSGFEAAESMNETAAAIHLISPSPVKLAWKTHYVGHLRAVNNNVLDTYQLKSQNTIVDAIIEGIVPRDGKLEVSVCYTHADEQRIKLSVDRVITCTGFRFDASIFGDTSQQMLVFNGRYPAQTSSWESSNIKDLYYAGTLMHMRDYQKTFSGFIHGFRYNIEALDSILARRYENEDWPVLPIASDPYSIRDLVVQRANTCSTLFQQPGFLCDAIVLPEQGQKALYYQNLPVDYVHDTELGQNDHYFLITMEYGHEDHCDPFNIQRQPDKGMYSAFIHPVIRHFNRHTQLSEYHVPEDLENNWSQDLYLHPFLSYLCNELL